MGVIGQRHAPTTLLSGEIPGAHFIGGRVGPRFSLDGCKKKTSLPPGFDSRTAQPVASPIPTEASRTVISRNANAIKTRIFLFSILVFY